MEARASERVPRVEPAAGSATRAFAPAGAVPEPVVAPAATPACAAASEEEVSRGKQMTNTACVPSPVPVTPRRPGSAPRHVSDVKHRQHKQGSTHRRRSRERLRESEGLLRRRCLCRLCFFLPLSFSSRSRSRDRSRSGRSGRSGLRGRSFSGAPPREDSHARRSAWRRSCSSLDRMMGLPRASAPLDRTCWPASVDMAAGATSLTPRVPKVPVVFPKLQ